MTRRWMNMLMAMLALTVLATSGCVRKKGRATSFDPNAGLTSDQLVYDEWGNLIDPATGLPYRTEGAIIAAGQFEPIYFEYDSPQLNPTEQSKIALVVTSLQANPTHGVIIEAHCDERGSNEYNLSLSERRALAVRAALISSGIDGIRLQTRGYGEERPVAFGHDESSWRLNRRAEFIFTQM